MVALFFLESPGSSKALSAAWESRFFSGYWRDAVDCGWLGDGVCQHVCSPKF